MPYFGGSSRLAGDPGFFDVFKRIGGAVLKGALGIPGAVIGEVISGGGRQQPPVFVPPRGAPAITAGTALKFGVAAGGAAAGFAAARNGAVVCPSGYHLNRSSYFLRDGTFVPEGTRMVRNRSRNPYNKKAATKASGRLKALGTGMKTIRKSVKAAAKELG